MAVWLEKGKICHVPLTLALSEKVKSTKRSDYIGIKDVGVNGQVVIVRQNGLDVVMGFENDATTKTLWEFDEIVRHPCTSIYDWQLMFQY